MFEQEWVSLVIETIAFLTSETVMKWKAEGKAFCDSVANILLEVFMAIPVFGVITFLF